jgi:glycosyltransferase involved in cell wall biosynthesis
MIGAVQHDEVKWFYAACDLFVYPAVTDRILNVVLEAQACGRAIVGLRTPSMEVTVDDPRTGLLAKDVDEFRDQLAMLLRKPAVRESMGQAARRYIDRFHSIEGRVRQIEDMLAGRA